MAMDRDLSQGTKRTKIGGKPTAIASSNLKTSTGDEAGSVGGLISNKTKGKLTFGSSSVDVSFEGKGVVRFGDITQHNGNTYNTVLAAAGQVAVAYGDDPLDDPNCSICGEPKPKHSILPNDDISRRISDLRQRLVEGEFSRVFVKGKNNKPLKKGVMIGALSCQCDARKMYAGLAGTRYDDGAFLAGANAFNRAAAEVGLIPVVSTPPGPPLSGFSPPAAVGGGFGPIGDSQWQHALEQVERNTERGYRGNAPLACAAPKMIEECLADGHKPGYMIEIWVSLRKTVSSTVKVTPLHALVWDASGRGPCPRIERVEEQTFGDGDAVPSCATCQILCTKALCNTGKPPCP